VDNQGTVLVSEYPSVGLQCCTGYHHSVCVPYMWQSAACSVSGRQPARLHGAQIEWQLICRCLACILCKLNETVMHCDEETALTWMQNCQ